MFFSYLKLGPVVQKVEALTPELLAVSVNALLLLGNKYLQPSEVLSREPDNRDYARRTVCD